MSIAASMGGHRFLTLAEVAEVLRLPLDEVFSLVRSGELAAIRVGSRGQWRVEHGALEAYIADQYEIQRSLARFHEAQFVDIPEISFGRGDAAG